MNAEPMTARRDERLTGGTGELTDVRVVDIKMPFGSMVVFMVKWAIAAIPAVLILAALYLFVIGVLVGAFSHHAR